jgi:hypothetical protein
MTKWLGVNQADNLMINNEVIEKSIPVQPIPQSIERGELE